MCTNNQHQDKCQECLIGYEKFCDEICLLSKSDYEKYGYNEDITYFKYCPKCGCEINIKGIKDEM